MIRNLLPKSFATFTAFCLATATAVAWGTAVFAQSAQPVFQERDFSIVPAGNPLYNHLRVVKLAGWAGSDTSETTLSSEHRLSRYELALETAKAVFTVEARHRADSSWSQKADRQAARALHALVTALTPELLRFDIAVEDVLQLLSNLSRERHPGDTVSLRTTARPFTTTEASGGELRVLPLSQRLRVYGAINPLAREQQDLFAAHRGTTFQSSDIPNIFRLQNRFYQQSEGVSGSATVALDLTERLRLRTGFEQHLNPSPSTLQSAVMGSSSSSSIFSRRSLRETSVGGGLDFEVTPGFLLSGDVARVNAGNVLADGTRFESGIGLTGWQNRVALSAHLSHLVPEDSMALGLTAAQLNLGIEVTRQIQLKLLYQQMFGATEAAQNNRIIGGGINVRF